MRLLYLLDAFTLKAIHGEMTTSTSISSRSGRWTCPRSFALTVVTLVCLLIVGFIDFHNTAQAQKRRVRRPTTRSTAAPARIDYTRFSHATSKHQGACNTCHKVPTDNWKKVRDYPDVADYPGHDACVSCHRPQFFRGAKPPICSVCHSKVSPRDDARFTFRNPSTPRQFLIEFPHDKHQDVIAQLRKSGPFMTQTATAPRGLPAWGPRISLRAWAHARSSATPQTQTNSLRYNNCEICHGPRTAVPPAPATGWVDPFLPEAAAFRAVPTSHASCFNCHWKSEQPTSENCAGCHTRLSRPVLEVFGVLDLTSTPAEYVPNFLPELRISRKFRHSREQHVQECTTCHINITRSATLRGLQPDVPITGCSECHQREGLREDVGKELEAIDKNRDFVCSYCHTSDVGCRDPPAGHYLISGRDPITRKDNK